MELTVSEEIPVGSASKSSEIHILLDSSHVLFSLGHSIMVHRLFAKIVLENILIRTFFSVPVLQHI